MIKKCIQLLSIVLLFEAPLMAMEEDELDSDSTPTLTPRQFVDETCCPDGEPGCCLESVVKAGPWVGMPLGALVVGYELWAQSSSYLLSAFSVLVGGGTGFLAGAAGGIAAGMGIFVCTKQCMSDEELREYRDGGEHDPFIIFQKAYVDGCGFPSADSDTEDM